MALLPEKELAALRSFWPAHEVVEDGGTVAVILRDFVLPEGFAPRVVDVLLRLPFGFPDAAPDMYWVSPTTTLYGGAPQNTGFGEQYVGRLWQRFSRHLPEGAWRAGLDGIRSYVALIIKQLEEEAACRRAA